jgi:hypothetical protein
VIARTIRAPCGAGHNDNYTIADEIFARDYIRHDASDPVQGPGEAVLQSERTREVKEIVPDLDDLRGDPK